MARSRFVGDAGLTARMTLVMFLLGAVFVALIVGLMYAFRGSSIAILIGIGGIGFAIYQWYNSDKVAMRAMRAREVTPEEAPELHGMIDRLCALADMPKPRVGIADTNVPNAFATGRSPEAGRGLRDHRHPADASPPRSSRACSPTSSPTSPTATCW